MAEAPERLFVQLTPIGGTISYISKPPDNRRPVYEYIRADLPRATADALWDDVVMELHRVRGKGAGWPSREAVIAHIEAIRDGLQGYARGNGSYSAAHVEEGERQ